MWHTLTPLSIQISHKRSHCTQRCCFCTVATFALFKICQKPTEICLFNLPKAHWNMFVQNLSKAHWNMIVQNLEMQMLSITSFSRLLWLYTSDKTYFLPTDKREALLLLNKKYAGKKKNSASAGEMTAFGPCELQWRAQWNLLTLAKLPPAFMSVPTCVYNLQWHTIIKQSASNIYSCKSVFERLKFNICAIATKSDWRVGPKLTLKKKTKWKQINYLHRYKHS